MTEAKLSTVMGHEVKSSDVSIDDLEDKIHDKRILVKDSGNLWTEPGDFYLVIPGATFSQVYYNGPAYAEAMKELGIEVDLENLALVSDVLIS